MRLPSSCVVNNLLSLFHTSCLPPLFFSLGWDLTLKCILTPVILLLTSGGTGRKEFPVFSLGTWSHDGGCATLHTGEEMKLSPGYQSPTLEMKADSLKMHCVLHLPPQ